MNLISSIYLVRFIILCSYTLIELKEKKEKGKQRLFAISFKPVAIISAELLLT